MTANTRPLPSRPAAVPSLPAAAPARGQPAPVTAPPTHRIPPANTDQAGRFATVEAEVYFAHG